MRQNGPSLNTYIFSIKIRILTLKCLHVILFLLNPSTTSTTKNIKQITFSCFPPSEEGESGIRELALTLMLFLQFSPDLLQRRNSRVVNK